MKTKTKTKKTATKKKLSWIAAIALLLLGMAACHEDRTASANAPAAALQAAVAAATEAPPGPPVDDERERARKQARLDYAAMEDRYTQDPNAQWAASAKASSTYGEHDGIVAEVNAAANAVGAIDDKTWTNDQQSVGVDWLELAFDRPVNATEVRLVFTTNRGVEAVSQIELQDTEGNWHSVWSGPSDVMDDLRGRRSWFVKSFEPTSYKARAVKITIANPVQRGYKEVDAVQLIGR